MSASVPMYAAAPRRGHFGAWRAAASAPAMVGSLLLLLVAFGWMGQWEGLVLLAWLASGAAVFTRVGERAAVAVGCGFRRLSQTQAAALDPVWASALTRAGLARSDVDLYVQRSDELNAYAAGGGSVALTSGGRIEISGTASGLGSCGGDSGPRPIDRTSDLYAIDVPAASRFERRRGRADGAGGCIGSRCCTW